MNSIGSEGMFLIVGPPGVGKSTLLIQTKARLPLLLVQQSTKLKAIFSSLELETGKNRGLRTAADKRS